MAGLYNHEEEGEKETFIDITNMNFIDIDHMVLSLSLSSLLSSLSFLLLFFYNRVNRRKKLKTKRYL